MAKREYKVLEVDTGAGLEEDMNTSLGEGFTFLAVAGSYVQEESARRPHLITRVIMQRVTEE